MAYAPENTMKSFRLAFELGADMIELDTQLTSDGYAVVNHNKSFNKTTPPAGKINELSLDQIKQLKMQGEPIPLLEEAIALCKEKGKMIDIECKDRSVAAEVVRLLKKYQLTKATIVTSFIPSVLSDIKTLEPSLKTGNLVMPILYAMPIRAALKRGCHAVVPNKNQINAKFIEKAHEKNLKVISWTINDTETMKRFVDLGIDGIITNKPDALEKILSS